MYENVFPLRARKSQSDVTSLQKKKSSAIRRVNIWYVSCKNTSSSRLMSQLQLESANMNIVKSKMFKRLNFWLELLSRRFFTCILRLWYIFFHVFYTILKHVNIDKFNWYVLPFTVAKLCVFNSGKINSLLQFRIRYVGSFWCAQFPIG